MSFSRTRTRLPLGGYLLLWMVGAPATFAFHESIHRCITEEALLNAVFEVEGTTLGFSHRSVDQVMDANEAMDDLSSSGLRHPERHYLGNSHQEASRRLVLLRTEIVELLKKNDGFQARLRLGRALHAVQDFYSHSNWVETGRTEPRTELYGSDAEAAPAAAPAPCPRDPNLLDPMDGEALTLAFFTPASLVRCPVIEPGLCQHGNWETVPGCPGINKDLDAALAERWDVEPSPYHARARAVAGAATTEFVESLVQEIREEVDNDLEALAVFFGSGALGLVLDVTGSMETLFPRVVTEIEELTRGEVFPVGPKTDLPLFYLRTISDPYIPGPGLLTASREDLLRAVSEQVPDGGGACSEPIFEGLEQAISDAPRSSELFVVTDAPDARPRDWQRLKDRAWFREVRVHFWIFEGGRCSPSPEYWKLANGTGGVHRIFPENDLAGTSSDGKADTPSPVLPASFSIVRLGPGSVEIPVDSTMNTLAVLASSERQTPRLSLFGPSGERIGPGTPGYGVIESPGSVLVTVESPEIGRWRLEAEGGEGALRWSAASDSPIEVFRFQPVEDNGELHGGYIPLPGVPRPGVSILGDLRLFGAVHEVEFTLVDEAGQSLGPLPLGAPTGGGRRYVGSFVVPEVPFRVRARGRNDAGEVFERVSPYLVVPAALDIVPEKRRIRVFPGEQRPVRFELTDPGDGGEVQVAVTGRGLDRGFFSYVLSLEPSRPETFEYTLRVPEETPVGASIDLVLTAYDDEDRSLGFSRVEIAVEEPGALACSDSILCLQDGRFTVRVDWRDFAGNTGRARAAVQSEDSGTFSFFDPANWELMLKILDGCDLNGHYWVFAGAATNLEYRIEVSSVDGPSKVYANPLGSPATPILDTKALPCSAE